MTNEQYEKLLRSFPRMHREMVEGITTLVAAVGLAVFFACLFGRSEPLWPVMVAAIPGALLPAVVLMLKRVNPYEGNLYAKLEGTSLARMQHVAGALALIETLRSRAAYAFLIRVAVLIALGIVMILPIASLAYTYFGVTPMRSRLFDEVIAGVFMFGVSSIGVEAILLLRWAVQRVKQREFPV
jgi:hypothetical protein